MPPVTFHLSPEDASGVWREELERAAREGLARAEERLGLPLDAPPTIRSIAGVEAFHRALGRRPHNLVAVAVAAENLVLVNRSAFLATGGRERTGTLAHEFSHLIVGRSVPGGVPRWLDEGLAMMVERGFDASYSVRLATATTFGNVRRLDSIWRSTTDADQSLAYAESVSATRFLLKEHGMEGDPGAFVRGLADPERGAATRRLLRDPRFMEAFERRWRESLFSLWTVLGALASDGFLWFFATVLLGLAWWRKRRMARRAERRWEREDEPLWCESDEADFLEADGIEEEEWRGRTGR